MKRTRSGYERLRAHEREIDLHIGKRISERRTFLFLSQAQLAELIGVRHQQVQKYEKGINRVAAGRLYEIAIMLGVDVMYFYDGLNLSPPGPTNTQLLMFQQLAKDFVTLDRRMQVALCALARTIVESETPRRPKRRAR